MSYVWQHCDWFNGACHSANSNILWQRQNGRHFADGIFKCILLNENIWILIEISLKFVPKSPINNYSSIGLDNGIQATSHDLNQWWLVYWRIYALLGLNELIGLLDWYPVIWSSLCNSFEDRAPLNCIYGCPIFKWVAVTSVKRFGTGMVATVMAARLTCPNPTSSMFRATYDSYCQRNRQHNCVFL